MTDRMTLQAKIDYNTLNIEIQSNSLDEEVKETLQNMINERENDLDYETLPEINHIIKSNSNGFEIQLNTNEGKIVEIVEDHIKEQKELVEAAILEEHNLLVNLHEQLNKELDQALSL